METGHSAGDGRFAGATIAAAARDRLAETLTRVGLGDRTAFAELYRATSAKLFGICLRILPRQSDAEDALQEAYVSIWRKAATFDRTRGGAMSWLIAIARNRAIDRLRASGGPPPAPIDLAEAIPDPAEPADARIEADDEARRLAACLDQLDAGDARLIRTAYFDGASYSELATRVGLPLGTIKSRIRRAFARVRVCLG